MCFKENKPSFKVNFIHNWIHSSVFSFLSLSHLDRDRIAIGSEEGLYVIEVTRDGKLDLSVYSNCIMNNGLHKF